MTTRFSQLLLGIVLASAAVASQAVPIVFIVDAKLNSSSLGLGVDTGLVVSAGDLITTSAAVDDLWSAGPFPRWSNANGLAGSIYATGSDETGQPAGTLIGQNYGVHTQDGFTFVYGALVGKVADTYFLLGTDFSGLAPASGDLSLFYWDINKYDNEGSIAVTVDIPGRLTPQQVPEPGTLALIGAGLAGLAMRRRARAG